jgi:hypothetical protein
LYSAIRGFSERGLTRREGMAQKVRKVSRRLKERETAPGREDAK